MAGAAGEAFPGIVQLPAVSGLPAIRGGQQIPGVYVILEGGGIRGDGTMCGGKPTTMSATRFTNTTKIGENSGLGRH